MKKYIKPTTEWSEIENLIPLAASPAIDPTPAPPGAEACSLGEEEYPVVIGWGNGSDSEGSY